ncbi:TPA: histidinol dehydrogenase [Candidatus Poribacteria bacterium]|mgnify:CR=1 FL=1|nr:histidinol dehydrogenase [Candidatus Poribacteria bacterium]HIA69879.1 histidinol dehydrogenase [Candidatus Poribacteria bacterium]HIB88030.1 histidinol dehydrogenase [Candidatus Poribacteria bacterium]HIC03824.1 histidinol dehydrogenase [Candidatus Poribacteria bacterium]HIC16737.1 histidinol dehydrogenase [Candidatus Poribacteria bacterium]
MIKIVEYNSELSKEMIKKLEHRSQFENEPILMTVREILTDVRETGDNAVVKYTRKFDAPDISLHDLQITDREIDLAYSEVEEDFLGAISLAKSNIESFHQKQLRNSWITTETNGVILGHLLRPLHRVGVCVPSVSQLLVSSLIMNVIPARVAGVDEIAVFMGPKPDGTIDPHMLVAAAECGTREIYRCGGAQAVAAMAYGTNTIAKVDKVVGPGNLYVQVAKKEVYGLIDIDKIAGPSEVLVIADQQASPLHIAADLISQAEHGEDSSAILVTTSKEIAEAVQSQIVSQVVNLPRQKEITGAFENYGVAFVVENLDQAISLANHIAPEHIELDVADPLTWIGNIRNAGAIMIGKFTPESVGDYIAGPNHILPTGGTAKYASPLSVDDFIKKTSLIHYTKSALKEVTPAVTKLAHIEGLKGHAAAMEIRFDTD